MDLRAVAVDEIRWISGNAPSVELRAQDAWLAVAERDDEWMLSKATRSGPEGAKLATRTFTRDTMRADSAVVAGAGVIAQPATTARVEGLGSRDVVVMTSQIWLVGLVRDDSDAQGVISVHLVDQHGARVADAIRLRRDGTVG